MKQYLLSEGREHIGGLTVSKAPDPDAALPWGRELARVITLPIQVRPMAGEAGSCAAPRG